VYACMRVCICVCMCMRMCMHARCMYLFTYDTCMSAYLCVHMYVCIWDILWPHMGLIPSPNKGHVYI